MKTSSQLVVLLEQNYIKAKNSSTQDMRATLMAGLCWKTHYWVDCALNWIEQGAETDMEIIARLEEISANKCYPQNTRHRAFALAKRWHKQNSSSDI